MHCCVVECIFYRYSLTRLLKSQLLLPQSYVGHSSNAVEAWRHEISDWDSLFNEVYAAGLTADLANNSFFLSHEVGEW